MPFVSELEFFFARGGGGRDLVEVTTLRRIGMVLFEETVPNLPGG